MKNAARRMVVVVAVDDDFRVRESIESLLESAGFTPELFSSGEEFLHSGKLSVAACVITDVRMPGMSGLELQRQIRLERPALPVIFISARNDPNVRAAALKEGAIDFLQKPFDGTDLLEKVRTALSDFQN
jgi:FixJ family two-component response regulator